MSYASRENICTMQPKKEKHYQNVIDLINQQPEVERELGVGIAWAFYDDPKRLVFTFSRYKFASKMIDGRNHVLEVGCGDGFASRILRQAVPSYTGIDVDNTFIENANKRLSKKWNMTFAIHDLSLQGPVKGDFDCAVCLDVLEHIPFDMHKQFLNNLVDSLSQNAVAVIGCPSLESQEWASDQSKLGHVACMTQSDFRDTLLKKFKYVFVFSMNDEVVHTGYSKMSHYNIAICGA